MTDKLKIDTLKVFMIIISILVAFIGGVVFVNTSVASSNKNEIKNIKQDIDLIKKDYVDVIMFGKLVRTHEMQYEILMLIKEGDKKALEEWREKFEQLRREILFDIPVPVRGGKAGNPSVE